MKPKLQVSELFLFLPQWDQNLCYIVRDYYGLCDWGRCEQELLAAKLCPFCLQKRYCSRECQKQHWEKGEHKKECLTNIRGLDKVKLLEALWHNVPPAAFYSQGHAYNTPPKFRPKLAARELEKGGTIDYFCGRPIKTNLSLSMVDFDVYNRDAIRPAIHVIQSLRKAQKPPSQKLSPSFSSSILGLPGDETKLKVQTQPNPATPTKPDPLVKHLTK